MALRRSFPFPYHFLLNASAVAAREYRFSFGHKIPVFVQQPSIFLAQADHSHLNKRLCRGTADLAVIHRTTSLGPKAQ